MISHSPLVLEFRGKLLDIVHEGSLAIVDENSNLIFSVGDPKSLAFIRSSAKPMQALPVIARGLDKKYNLTDEETVIFSGSHVGDSYHVAALENIMKKAGLNEDMMIMKPTSPTDTKANKTRIEKGLPDRKFYHNCSGKHSALMLLQRDLTGNSSGYELPDSPAQIEIQRTIKTLTQTDTLEIGVDGCGVPVYACSVKNIATAYKNVACIDTIDDNSIRMAAEKYIPRINKHPHMMRGNGYLCSLINYDENIIAKGGAAGIYGFGLKKQRLGIAFKVADGTEKCWEIIIMEVLRALGALPPETEERLNSLEPALMYNDNNDVVGQRELAFTAKI